MGEKINNTKYSQENKRNISKLHDIRIFDKSQYVVLLQLVLYLYQLRVQQQKVSFFSQKTNPCYESNELYLYKMWASNNLIKVLTNY